MKVDLVDVEAIKESVDIWMVLDEIGAARQGSRVFCPFCADAMSSNPGASVTPDGCYYTCWVCGLSGDVITLAREHTGFGFPDACEWLRRTFRIDG